MLTAKQQQTLEFIRTYMSENQQAPTEAEIAAGIGIKSRGVAHRYVAAIEAAGYIKTLPGKRRNIRLRHNYKNQVLGLPLMGQLTAQNPIKPVASQDVFNVNTKMLKPNRYLLQVGDDSLQNCGIFNGDFIVCELQSEAKSGDIVVAIIAEKKAQLKTLCWHGDGSVTLSDPYTQQNAKLYAAKSIKIHGVYKGLFRISDQ